LNRFFVPESNGEALLEDAFIQGLRPFLRQLDWEQWQSILKRLAAISDHVGAAAPGPNMAGIRTMPQPARMTAPPIARRPNQSVAVGQR
jgi:hypothetical protein